MKLKLVVASMSVLGLISSPLFADDAKAKHHRHHHHKHHAKHVEHDYKDYKDYKDMGPVEAACTISPNTIMMEVLDHNFGRALPNPCNPGWFNRIRVSGGLNFDAWKWGARDEDFLGENYNRVSINDVYINISADINSWAKAFASISYNNTSPFYGMVYSNSAGNEKIILEQVYATLGNLDETPVFVQFGKKFLDHGRYEIHAITRTPTQVMSETLAPAIELGFLTSGFHGSVTVFEDRILKIDRASKKANYLGALGYDQMNDQFGWGVGVSYMYDIFGVNDVAGVLVPGFYTDRVGTWSVYGDVNSGPFTIGARYVTVSEEFDMADFSYNNDGARPWAAGVKAGYSFNAFFDRNQNIYLGYDVSREALALQLPRSRWTLGYNMDVFENVNVGVEWNYDQDYHERDTSTFRNGSGDNSHLVTIRGSVKFA